MKAIFKDRSAGIQFMIILLLGMAGALFFTLLGVGFAPLFFDLNYADLIEGLSDPLNFDVEVLKYLQVISSLGTFLLPGIIAAILFSSHWKEYLGIDKIPSRPLTILFLMITLSVSSTVVTDLLFRLSNAFEWPESWGYLRKILEESEVAMGDQIAMFLNMNSIGEFLGVFFIMAILPALGEEVLFRGVLQPVIYRGFGNHHTAVWVTAFLFALLHQQVYAFLSIMALGVILGYLRVWTTSLWVPIGVHLINNGAIVIGVYFFDVPYDNSETINESPDIVWVFTALLAFAASMFAIFRVTQKQKTPKAELPGL